MDLDLVLKSRATGEFSCQLSPEFDVLSWQSQASFDVIHAGCTIEVQGTGVSGPAPVCALDPPSAVVDFGEVEIGSERWAPLIISNQTPDAIPTNQFFYAFDNPTNDCSVFSMSPDDSSGVVGPAGSAQIPVRFAPASDGAFQCTRGLSTLAEPGGEQIENPCSGVVTWTGTGVIGAPTWHACSPAGTSLDFHAVTGLSASEVYVAGDGGAVLTSSGDCQWEYAGTGYTEVDLRDLWVHEDGGQRALWAAGNIPPPQGLYQATGAVLYSDGSSWSDWTKIDEDGLVTFEAVWGSGFDDVYFAGLGVSSDFPNAKRFTGDSQNLEEFIISWFGMNEVTGLSGTAADEVWAVFSLPWNSVYRFNGGTPSDPWEDLTPPYAPLSPLNDVFARKAGTWEAVYAVGADGAIYHYDGQQWLGNETIKGEDGDFHGVWVSPKGTVFAVGEGPMIYRGHVNEPGQWTLQTPPAGAVSAGDVLLDVWGTDDDHVYAVGTNGVILQYRAEGASTPASR